MNERDIELLIKALRDSRPNPTIIQSPFEQWWSTVESIGKTIKDYYDFDFDNQSFYASIIGEK
jgi:hypothetical protein